MTDESAKKAILARRARFIAAAMMGTGLATCKSGPPADPSTVQAPEYPPPEPQACLSPPPPQPCLSVTLPPAPADTASVEADADPADAGAPAPPPHPCLSVRPRPCLKALIKPQPPPKPQICLSFSP